MSEAPERIWATVNGLRTGMPGAHSWLIGGWEARAKQSDRETEYVHNDLFDAVKAERDNYKALYEAERDDELLNIARQAGYQDGATSPKYRPAHIGA